MTAPHKEPNYVMIWLWLTILTVIELGTTQLPIPRLSIAILLVGEAVTKALLVAMYFMHLRFEKKTLAMIAVSPLVLCIWLSLMLMPDSAGARDSVVPVPSAAPTPPATGEEGHEQGETPTAGEAPSGEAGHDGTAGGEAGASGAPSGATPASEPGGDATSGGETPPGK